jgi:tetratricopeptide (TPR) repeat protein
MWGRRIIELDKADFFISYNKADGAWAEWIAWQLEEAGYKAIIQAWDFRPGGAFALDMHEGLKKAERVLAILSPDYLTALYTQPEWAAAFAQDPTGEKGLLLPARVRECKLEGLLPQIIYIDLVGVTEAEAGERLLSGVKRERAKPAASPQFPGAPIAHSGVAKPNFPGALPPVWNVPHRENPHFVGRDQLLDQIHETLSAGRAAAIHGLGGVGKTQLAAHYAHHHKGDYQIVWWIKAEEPATLAGDYAALATALDLPEKEAREQPLIIEAMRRWLEQHPGWMLIFDNARDAEVIRPYLPHGAAGHALITSRDPNWRGAASPLEVRTLLREDAARFLLERTGQSDEAASRDLAAELSDLPLALEQAGAYIEETGEALARYAELFGARRRELQLEERPPAGYPDTVATTWLLSFQQAEQQAPAAADLLRLCAFLAPDDIPLSMLRVGAEHLPAALAAAVTDQLACNRTIAALRRYSLITKHDDSFSIHRLVQLVARDQLTEDERRRWAEVAVRIVNQVFPFESEDPRTWPICEKLLPHAQAAIEEGGGGQVDAEATTRLINQMGMYFYGRAQYAEAKQAFERSLIIGEEAFGPDHPRMARINNNLGGVLKALGKLGEARRCYERALRIDEAAFGPDHPNVARVVNNLGSALENLGNLGEARQCFERALRIYETTFGPDHPYVARVVNNIGGVLKVLGSLSEARLCYERALRIDEAAFGPDHPHVANGANNLGGVMYSLGNLSEARRCFERALQIYETTFGHNHPDVAKALNNLGRTLKDLGNLGEAYRCFERALRVNKAAFGPGHPNVARDMSNLGSVNMALGILDKAREYYERAQRINEAAFGPGHPTVAVNISNLGNALYDLGNLNEARRCFERALRIDEVAFGPDHLNVAIRAKNLGNALEALGKLSEARQCFERALRIFTASLGEDHPNTVKVGNILKSLG